MSFTRLCGFAAAAVLWAGAALAQVSAPGVPTIGPAPQLTFPPGGAAVPYTPSAVTFSPETSYGILGSSLGVTDTSHAIISFWLRGMVGTTTNPQNDSNWTAQLTLIFSNPANGGSCDAETCPGMTMVFDNAASTVGTLRENINDATGGLNHSFQGQQNSIFSPLNATWHHWLFVYDMNYAQGSKRNALYIDGVKQSLANHNAESGTVTGACGAGPTGSFCVNENSPNGFTFNSHSASGNVSGAYDIADFFVDTHTTSLAGCASIIDASDNVCANVVNAFYNAGPVALGTNCATPLGSQPELCFSGNKGTGTSGGFLVNQGTASATLGLINPTVGAVATPQLWNAPYGPAGPPTDRPYFRWVASSHLTGQSAATVSMATFSRGNPIAQGDLLILAVALGDTSTAFNRAIQTPLGWTLLTTTTAVLPYCNGNVTGCINAGGSHPANYAVFYRSASAGDVTASGTEWGSPPTIAWLANANSLRGAAWELLDYGGANVTTPIQVADAQFNISTATTSVAPAVTPTGSPTTLLSLHLYWANAGFAIYPDTNEDLRFKQSEIAGSAFPNRIVADQAYVGTSSTGTRTASQSSTAEASLGINMVLTK